MSFGTRSLPTSTSSPPTGMMAKTRVWSGLLTLKGGLIMGDDGRVMTWSGRVDDDRRGARIFLNIGRRLLLCFAGQKRESALRPP